MTDEMGRSLRSSGMTAARSVGVVRDRRQKKARRREEVRATHPGDPASRRGEHILTTRYACDASAIIAPSVVRGRVDIVQDASGASRWQTTAIAV
jgi:hypothetical protein